MKKNMMNTMTMLVLFCGITMVSNLQAEDAETVEKQLEGVMKTFEAGKIKEALIQIDQIQKENPENTKVLYLRARMHDNVNQFKKAADDYTLLIKLMPDQSDFYHFRGVSYFNMGEFKKSVKDFDQYIEKNPGREAQHWQRGISHYYAKMYSAGSKQFTVHQTVNSQDVENAVWHFLCVSREESIQAAQKGLIEIQSDSRIPMMKVHELFREVATVEDVLSEAEKGAGKISENKLRMQRFYAHLYLGLYFEAHQKMKLARKHIHLSATKYSVPGYMGNVARVHDREFQKQQVKK